jgi:hypothetical protein
MWWNEQWMNWTLGPQYSESSNVDNAYELQGKALIIIGEMDSNVDPAPSLQVVNALVESHKHFDMLYIPGQNHGVGIPAQEHYRDDGGLRIQSRERRIAVGSGVWRRGNRLEGFLHGFTFPFSRQNWDSFSAGMNGSIVFGSDSGGGRGGGGRGGGVTLARFDQLGPAAEKLVDQQPAICIFLRLRMSGHRFVKETADRVLVTWDLTEPFGGIQDFTWTPTVNRFQLTLHKDGIIQMSYEQVAAKDAIVGVFPKVPAGSDGAAKDLSALKPSDGPFPVVYESFHYLQLPNAKDLTCSVIQGLGDKFDMLAYYSDFRVDNQEAGTPSNGPLGGHVTGIGQVERGLET